MRWALRGVVREIAELEQVAVRDDHAVRPHRQPHEVQPVQVRDGRPDAAAAGTWRLADHGIVRAGFILVFAMITGLAVACAIAARPAPK
jgi:hypothetical protein